MEDPIAALDGLEAFAVDLDADLVRSAPQRLELPTPDGRVLVAEMTVFEDRGNGDAMWAGGFPGAGYESVVLTVRDGYLAGRFGEPGGAKYLITVGPDGRGRMIDTSVRVRDAEDDYCPGGVVPPLESPVPVPQAQEAGSPGRIAGESNHDVLNVLILYTAESERRWGLRNNTPAVAIQQSVDYLAQVFRNGQLGVTPNLVHFEEAPPDYAAHEPQGEQDSQWSCGHVLSHLPVDPDVARLRAEHQADVVHLFIWGLNGCSGIAYLLQRGGTSSSFSGSAFGLTLPRSEYDSTFAHEVGHNMGANHDPQNTNNYEERRNSTAVEPYAFGHTDFAPIPNIDTIMSYGSGRVEPYFSTVRITPRGWTLGIAGERENERAMQRTVHMAVQYGDSLDSTPPPEPPEPPPPGDQPTAPEGLAGSATSPTSVHLTWLDRSDNEDNFEVEYRPDGGRWQRALNLPANTTSADVSGLESGGRYDFRVRARNANGRANSNVVTVVLPVAEYSDCEVTKPLIEFEHGFNVSMCVEYRDRETQQIKKEDAFDYGLDSAESGILYFFKPDNAEVLVKVLNGCGTNGYYWVFVAPVTDLAFNLYIEDTTTKKRWKHRHPRQGGPALTARELGYFPCDRTGAGSAVAGSGGDHAGGVELVDAGFSAAQVASVPTTRGAATLEPPEIVRQPLAGGEYSDCDPEEVLTLSGGFKVKMCAEQVKDGQTVSFDVRDYGLDSQQSGIMYFLKPNNAEVLIKVLNGCPINNHYWVYVAPVTDLAFNLTVESPDGEEEWTHNNALGDLASTAAETQAFTCAAD